MLKTTLYFAGSGTAEGNQYIVDNGWARLFSQLNDRNAIQKWIDIKKDRPDLKLFIDSGAFSMYTKGKTVDVDDYINYMNTNGMYFNVMAQVDVIPGKSNTDTNRELYLNAPRQSWENFLAMREKLDKSLWDRFIPVYHAGEDYKWLHNMLTYKDPDTGEKVKYIAISPPNESSVANRFAFCKECFHRIEQLHPTVNVHGFGMTVLDILPYLNFTSVDSTTWIQTAIHGSITIRRHEKFKAISVGERTTHLPDHFCYLGTSAKEEIINLVEELGFSSKGLRELKPGMTPSLEGEVEPDITNSIAQRQMFNAKSMMHYMNTMNHVPLPKTVRRIGR